MKNFVILWILALLLFSCQQEIKPSLSQGKLKKMTEKITESTYTTTEFSYDLTGKLSQINTFLIDNDAVKTSKKEEFSRNSQGIITKVKTLINEKSKQSETEKIITYNENQNIIKITEYNRITNNQLIEQITYAADELGIQRPTNYDKLQLKNIKDTVYAFIPLEANQYTWNKGNIISARFQNYLSNTTKEIKYTYDESINNPLNLVYEYEVKIPNVLALSTNQVATMTETPEYTIYKNDNYALLSRSQQQTQYKQIYGRWEKIKDVLFEFF